jgi:hypothetical protein
MILEGSQPALQRNANCLHALSPSLPLISILSRTLHSKSLPRLTRAHVAISFRGITLIHYRYVANLAVVRQLHKQVNEENALQKSIIIMQQNSAHFEEGIVRAIQSAWQTFDEWQSRMSASVQETWRSLGVHMASIPPDHEWISFSARSDHLLDPDSES